MIIRKLNQAAEQNRSVETSGWKSDRLILKDDGVGFSFHITIIKKDAVLDMHYKNHIESVYCISGKGNILDLETNETFSIEPGTMYLLDKHQKHRLSAIEEMQMACVFNPPLTGKEVHDEQGSYSLPETA